MDTLGHFIGMILGTGVFVGGPCFLVSIAGFRIAKGEWLPWGRFLASGVIAILASGVAYTVLSPFVPYGGASILILVFIPLLVSLVTIHFFYAHTKTQSGGSDDVRA